MAMKTKIRQEGKWDDTFDHLPIVMLSGAVAGLVPGPEGWAQVMVVGAVLAAGLFALHRWPALRVTRYMRPLYVFLVFFVGVVALSTTLFAAIRFFSREYTIHG